MPENIARNRLPGEFPAPGKPPKAAQKTRTAGYFARQRHSRQVAAGPVVHDPTKKPVALPLPPKSTGLWTPKTFS